MTTVAPQASSPKPPIAALCLGAFGALVGGLFPISVIFAMPDISGGLSASADDASWITTLYNVGQLVAQPLLIVLAASFGRGRTMQLAGGGFSLASLAIVMAGSLQSVEALRIVQGLFGGMMPTLMMMLVMSSPLHGRDRVAGLASFSITASLGVGLGAPVAAWFIGIGGWRMLFVAQALCGFLYFGLSGLVLVGERGDPARFKATDWGSYGLLSIGAALLTIGLSEGERRFWFDKWWIAVALVCGPLAIGLALALIPKRAVPLIRLSIFSKPTLRWALILQLLFRFGLMVAIVVAPQYLARTQGFRIEQLGPLMAPLALATLITGPVAWWLACTIDARIVLSLGLGLFAIAAGLASSLTSDWAAPEMLTPVLMIGVGQAFFGVAVLRFATFDVTPSEGPSVGVVFNFARVFGLVGGLAVSSHTIVEREKLHSAYLVENLDLSDPLVTQRMAAHTSAFGNWLSDPGAAQRAGVASLARAAGGQAYTQGYSDAFAVIAMALLASAILVWALPRLPNIPSTVLKRPS